MRTIVVVTIGFPLKRKCGNNVRCSCVQRSTKVGICWRFARFGNGPIGRPVKGRSIGFLRRGLDTGQWRVVEVGWSLALFVHIPGEQFKPMAHLTGLVNLPADTSIRPRTVRHTPTFGLGFGAGSGSSSAAACCNGTSLQTRPLFLPPFPLLICSSRHYRISSPCHHLTTGTPLQPSPSHLQRPLTSSPAPKWRSLPSPIRTCTDSDTDSQPRLFLHPCSRDSAADGIDSTSSHRCGSETT